MHVLFMEPISESINEAEHCLVGLSPGYFAHIPLMIADIHRILLINGVNFVQGSNSRLNPVSKCHLVGLIVALERRSGGSILLVIDDGTGLIDVLTWEDQELYKLPPLTPFGDTIESTLTIGMIVSVHGRIESVAVEEEEHTQGEHKIRSAIREIHASRVHQIEAPSAQQDSLDTESQHWLRCLKFSTQPNFTGKDALQMLGPDIRGQVERRENFPAADDLIGEWRVFGANCQCDLAYKYPLLYCHCLASEEAIDPNLLFRDALLNHLLDLESATEGKELRFLYQDIYGHPRLLSIAEKSSPNSVDASRVVVNTFKALRDDGILYLLDEESDTYVLVSRSRILEPYVRKVMARDIEGSVERMNLLKHRPEYLANVPRSKLQYIRRVVTAAERAQSEDRPP